MSLKSKGNGYKVGTVVDGAAEACAEKCGCSGDQFRKCAQRFAPAAKSVETASRVFADWHSTKNFPEVNRKMNCDAFGKNHTTRHHSSTNTSNSVQVAA